MERLGHLPEPVCACALARFAKDRGEYSPACPPSLH
jgi:hypothetical protein